MKTFLTILLFCFFGINYISAQVLKVSVKMQNEHLSEEDRNELEDLPGKIEDYFNSYSWTDDELEYDVNCTAQIIVETVQKTHEILYRCQFLISSESGENFYDKLWEFPYTRSQMLSHTTGQFDPLTKFLDFYAALILGGEYDSNGLLLGNKQYEAALEIVNQALMSQYSKGWTQRKENLLKITDIRTRPLREIKPDFFEAIYLYDEGNLKEAFKLANKVLEGLEKVYSIQPNNWYLQIFMNSHFRELAILFAGENEKLEKLEKIDSKHRETYREKMEKY
ncbi:MAG: DUF4835 family protein [Calditrichaceae bacterium]|nr:DUF4835 family protein [Calditrichaceae bacterium]MBN2708440.1 DUF4835 family protein [Calditrichaceae bacterium]